ncbi:secreted RxLR effector protein 161-like [Miscanthus floridulus]|uniref:secreted RxLR effector protein 161-like n=1 Tax=Miscanthus floridulus TaxID=154761 RepID=UPI0034577F6C
MEPRLKLLKESTAPHVDATAYRSIVGGLKYLLHTRPDLSYSVGYVSRFMEAPTEEHQAAVKHILRYVAGTTGLGIHYKRGDKKKLPRLHGYSDSDFAGDANDRKSTGEVIYFLDNGPISWQSSKQKVVVLSSCEAEYIAAAIATCQGVWLARLFVDLVDVEAKAPILRVDNKSAISLVKNPVHHDRTKHIDVKYHYVRECADRGLIDV